MIVYHCELVDPHNSSKALNSGRFLVGDEVANKEALAHWLYKFIVTLSWASRCAAGCTESARADTRNFIATRTFELIEVYFCSVALVKFVIELISRTFHAIKNVEAPINDMKIISVLVCTDVAHAGFTAAAVFEAFDVWVLVLIVHTTSWNVLRRLGRFYRSVLNDWLTSSKEEVCNFLHYYNLLL